MLSCVILLVSPDKMRESSSPPCRKERKIINILCEMTHRALFTKLHFVVRYILYQEKMRKRGRVGTMAGICEFLKSYF